MDSLHFQIVLCLDYQTSKHVSLLLLFTAQQEQHIEFHMSICFYSKNRILVNTSSISRCSMKNSSQICFGFIVICQHQANSRKLIFHCGTNFFTAVQMFQISVNFIYETSTWVRSKNTVKINIPVDGNQSWSHIVMHKSVIFA